MCPGELYVGRRRRGGAGGENFGGSTTGGATIVIYSATFPGIPGAVSVFNSSVPTHSTLFFGELVFSLDQ